MHLSTSSFDHWQSAKRGGAYRNLVALILVWLIGMELCCRLFYSHREHKFAEEYRSAIETSTPLSSHQDVVVLGNSLLDTGVRFHEARQALLPAIRAKRVKIDGTEYFDWYYGMRKLFADGARPHAVALVLTPRQFVSRSISGDYASFLLLQTTDILSFAEDVELTNTQTSNLIFAKASAFFAFRAEIRQAILRRLLPDLPSLMSLMTVRERGAMSDEAAYAIAVERMKELQNLTLDYGSRIVLVIPPTGPDSGDPMLSVIQDAGKAVGVPVLVPIVPGSLAANLYSDSFFHLNERGAHVFTPRFIESLQREVDRHR